MSVANERKKTSVSYASKSFSTQLHEHAREQEANSEIGSVKTMTISPEVFGVVVVGLVRLMRGRSIGSSSSPPLHKLVCTHVSIQMISTTPLGSVWGWLQGGYTRATTRTQTTSSRPAPSHYHLHTWTAPPTHPSDTGQKRPRPFMGDKTQTH